VERRLAWCLAVGASLAGGDAATGLAAFGLADRAALMAWARERLHRTTNRARGCAEVIAAMGWAAEVGWLSHDDANQVILVTGKLAQQSHASWTELSAAIGAPIETDLPWDLALDVTLFEPAAQRRVMRGSCPHCSAPRTRPSPSAYIYCDHCGELADYDFTLAAPFAPRPVFEGLRAKLGPALAAARTREDARAVQRELFAAFVDACPQCVPVRAKDPEYRARYIAWLAEGAVVTAFDPEATALATAMQGAVERLVFAQIDGRTRVGNFGALADAMFAFEARNDQVFDEVYALHPDVAPRELQRRIGFSLFAQGWLPYLDETEAAALLERTGLRADYDPVGTVATRTWPCASCGAPLELVAGARRVVCDHCGRRVDVIGDGTTTS
jgi:DNA-directed RNA polymerase subunit RPC12/RpoP